MTSPGWWPMPAPTWLDRIVEAKRTTQPIVVYLHPELVALVDELCAALESAERVVAGMDRRHWKPAS